MSHATLSQSVLNAALVLAESAITLVLRFDASLRRVMYPLAAKQTVVCLKTYLPHLQIYATFTNKGVLLDAKPPLEGTAIDITVNTYMHQFLQALVSNDPKQVAKIAMRGDHETVANLRDFLVQLGVASLIQSVIKTIKGKTAKSSDSDKDSKQPQTDYKALAQKQQNEVTALTIKNRELEISLKEARSKQKTILIALIVTSLIAVVAVITGVVIAV